MKQNLRYKKNFLFLSIIMIMLNSGCGNSNNSGKEKTVSGSATSKEKASQTTADTLSSATSEKLKYPDYEFTAEKGKEKIYLNHEEGEALYVWDGVNEFTFSCELAGENFYYYKIFSGNKSVGRMTIDLDEQGEKIQNIHLWIECTEPAWSLFCGDELSFKQT